jgi:hypothetical protein
MASPPMAKLAADSQLTVSLSVICRAGAALA